MKKNFKKLLALTLVFIMVLIPVQVSAKTLIPERVIYLPVHTGVVENIGFYPPDKKPKITLSNKKIGTIKKSVNDIGFISFDFVPKKAGKTLVTMKITEGTSKFYFKVVNYKNPVSSIKLGKTTIKGNKFNKTDKLSLSYSKYAKQSDSLKIVPKKGWRVRGFYSLDKKGETTYYSGNKFKPIGGKGNCTLRIVFASVNVNAQTYIDIDFK